MSPNDPEQRCGRGDGTLAPGPVGGIGTLTINGSRQLGKRVSRELEFAARRDIFGNVWLVGMKGSGVLWKASGPGWS
jgi:hypothetical protein